MIGERRTYRLAKRKAKHEYNKEQKERLHNVAIYSPQFFSREIKKKKSNDQKVVLSVTISTFNILRIYIQIVMGLVMMM